MRPSVALASLAIALTACGGAPAPAPVVATAPPPPPTVVEVTAPVIQRAALDDVLDAGLGAFLGRVSTAPSLDNGRFVGFRVVELLDRSLFDGVDLQPGDVVVSVNGQAIERPEQAFAAWTGLRVASEIAVALVRDGTRRDLRIPIVD